MFSYIQLIHNQHSTTCWPIYQLCNDRVLTNLLGRCTDWVFSLYISPYYWTTPTLSLGVPFVMRWKSGPLARSNNIPVLNGFANTIDWDQNKSDLSDLTQGMHRVMGSPWIADFRCWTWPEVAIPVTDQKDCGLWEQDWADTTCTCSKHDPGTWLNLRMS